MWFHPLIITSVNVCFYHSHMIEIGWTILVRERTPHLFSHIIASMHCRTLTDPSEVNPPIFSTHSAFDDDSDDSTSTQVHSCDDSADQVLGAPPTATASNLGTAQAMLTLAQSPRVHAQAEATTTVVRVIDVEAVASHHSCKSQRWVGATKRETQILTSRETLTGVGLAL